MEPLETDLLYVMVIAKLLWIRVKSLWINIKAKVTVLFPE